MGRGEKVAAGLVTGILAVLFYSAIKTNCYTLALDSASMVEETDAGTEHLGAEGVPQLVRDNALGDPDSGDDVSPENAQLADEGVAATGAGQEKAVCGEGILGTQQTEAVNQPTNERIHRDQALGFQLAEGHMDGPTIWADQAETIEG